MLILFLVILFLIFGRNGSYTITFDTNGGTEITAIEVKNNEIVKLPEAPKKDSHKFVEWKNEKGRVITKGTKVTEDITLKAEWVSNDAETITAEFNTDGGSKVGNIVVEKGKIIVLPVNPIKIGYVFAGWADENGNAITKDTIVNENITIKATWKEPYTCPADCTPIGDGSKCTKEVTKEMSNTSSCPSGYTQSGNTCKKTETISCKAN